ncbi:MAG TPA: hypothetical protein VEQ63_15775 [Bryobacteraceae bacterium]|nr:hypothetical protein [Bryobacteraceae bacterium]
MSEPPALGVLAASLDVGPRSTRRRFIENSPEDAKVTNGFDELVKVDWLDNVGVYAQLIALK